MKALSLIICLFTAIVGLAQTAGLQGLITLQRNEQPLPGVSIYLEGTSTGTVSRGNGQYALENLSPGTYTVVFRAVGFVTLEQQVVLRAGEIQSLSIGMVEDIAQLPAVVVESVTLTGGMGRIEQSTGSAFYLSPRQLDQFNYTDPLRTLRTVPGVYVQEEDGFGLRPNIGLRGAGSNRSASITVMEDGILAAPAPYAAPAAYYFPTIGRMHAVEVLKGSSQIKYGPYTTGGAINLISTPIPTTFSGKVNVIGGSFGTRQIHAVAGDSHTRFGYVVEAFQYGSDGFKQLDGGGPVGFDKTDLLAKVRFNSKPAARVYQSLQLKAAWMLEESHETYLGLTDEDFAANPFRRYAASANDIMNANHRQLTATYTAQFSKQVEASVAVYRNDFYRNWYKLDALRLADTLGTVSLASILNNPAANQEGYDLLTGTGNGYRESVIYRTNDRTYYAEGVQAQVKGQFTTGEVKHEVLVGVRAHRDAMDRFQYQDYYDMQEGALLLTRRDAPGSQSNQIESASSLAGFVQYSLEWKGLIIHPGIRAEHITMQKDNFGTLDPDRSGENLTSVSNTITTLLPGVGVNYAFGRYWHLFGGIHRGFSPPGTTAGTLPESSMNYEAGIRFNKESWQAEAVVYHNDYSNLLGSDNAASGGSGSTALFNGGSARVEGLELQAGVDVLSVLEATKWSLPIFVTYTYTHATFQNTFQSTYTPWGSVLQGDFLPYIPPHQLSVQASFESNRISLTMNVRYMSAMRTVAGSDNLIPSLSTDSHITADASAHYSLSRQVRLFASVLNATDAVYVAARRPAGVRPGTPRLALAGLKVAF